MTKDNDENFINYDELGEIADLIDTLRGVGNQIALGDVPVLDCNGEPLGVIEMIDGEPRFVPNGWRT